MGFVSNINEIAKYSENINIVGEAVKEGIGVTGQQFLGSGMVKGIQFFAAKSIPGESITVITGTNAFSVDSFKLVNGASITIENDATYKII